MFDTLYYPVFVPAPKDSPAVDIPTDYNVIPYEPIDVSGAVNRGAAAAGKFIQKTGEVVGETLGGVVSGVTGGLAKGLGPLLIIAVIASIFLLLFAKRQKLI